jgi:hypothetical protein
VPHKLIGRTLRILVIAIGDTNTPNVYHTSYPYVAVLHPIVQDVHALIAHRLTVWNAGPIARNAVSLGTQLKNVGPNSRLSCSTHADDSQFWTIAELTDAIWQRSWNPIPAHEYQPKTSWQSHM